MNGKALRPRSVTTPTPLALKSPQLYLQLIMCVNPEWREKLKNVVLKGATLWCALAAAAVAIGNACRISEVLGLEAQHLLPNGNAIMLGSKGSNARIIWPGFTLDTALHLKSLPPHTPLFPVKYQDVWRACVTHGLTVQEPGHEHRTVTHAGRYRVAQQIAAIAGDAKAGEALGHKSKRAVMYYVDTKTAAKERAMRKRAAAFKSFTTQGPRLPEFLRGV